MSRSLKAKILSLHTSPWPSVGGFVFLYGRCLRCSATRHTKPPLASAANGGCSQGTSTVMDVFRNSLSAYGARAGECDCRGNRCNRPSGLVILISHRAGGAHTQPPELSPANQYSYHQPNRGFAGLWVHRNKPPVTQEPPAMQLTYRGQSYEVSTSAIEATDAGASTLGLSYRGQSYRASVPLTRATVTGGPAMNLTYRGVHYTR
jgi:hypothetical protein